MLNKVYNQKNDGDLREKVIYLTEKNKKSAVTERNIRCFKCINKSLSFPRLTGDG